MAKSKEKIPKKEEKKSNEGKHDEKISESKDKKISKKHKSKKSKKEKPQPTTPIPENSITTAAADDDPDTDSDFDPQDLRKLLEPYTKDQLLDLITETAEKRSRLVTAVYDVADRDVSRRKLFVYGLGWDTTREALLSTFSPYGEIVDCTVVMDKSTGRAKGFGFVVYKTVKAANKALKIPQKKIFNRVVSCQLASLGKAGQSQEKTAIAATETVKISLDRFENQGQQQQQGQVPGQNLGMYGQYHPGFSTVYGGMLANPAALAGGFNYGMMSQGLVPSTHLSAVGGLGAAAPTARAWYLQ